MNISLFRKLDKNRPSENFFEETIVCQNLDVQDVVKNLKLIFSNDYLQLLSTVLILKKVEIID